MVDLVAEIRSVPRPQPVLSREREAALTPRQRELLDELTAVFDDGFAHLTMADLAARLGCSLRSLYQLAPSRDELLLVVVDRNLWRVGRAAQQVIVPGGSPIATVSAYLKAAHDAVSRTTDRFARDMASLPAAVELQRGHENYLVDVTTRLLDLAVGTGEIADIDTRVVARAAASMGRLLAQPDALGQTSSDPKKAADLIVDLLLHGLESRTAP
jgi:AcrR family transcriptional regulator